MALARVMLTAEARMAGFFAGHCEVGQKLGERIGLPAEVVESLAHLYERWDGKGLPNRLRGAAVSPVALIVSLAQDIVVHHDAGGWKAVEAMVRARRGRAHDPGMAESAARAMRLGGSEIVLARRAGWLHDLGRVGVSAAVWGKAGALTLPEREQVRLHAYYGERILSAAPALARIAEVACLAHDRLDGSGYFRRPPPSQIPPVARVLAAADVHHALTEARPHRGAHDAAAAARILRDEAGAGRLDVRTRAGATLYAMSRGYTASLH